MDSGYIAKTLLKATTATTTKVTSAPVGSPQNQEKGAFVTETSVQTPVHDVTNKTTTSGRSSDDPIKLGDELRYKELTTRVSKIKSSVGEIKSMLQQLLSQNNQPSVPTTAEI